MRRLRKYGEIQFGSTTMQMLIKGIGETLYMTFLSSAPSYVIGIPPGIALVVTDEDGISPIPLSNKVLGPVINIFRSIPFIILLTMVTPVMRMIIGKIVGCNATVVPPVITAIPYISRMAESFLKEVDIEAIEAAKSMRASTWQITAKMLLPEVKPSLLVGAVISVTTILGYSAVAGFAGGGGPGDIATRYGYYRYQTDIVVVTVALLIIIVQLIQEVFMKMSRGGDKRVR